MATKEITAKLECQDVVRSFLLTALHVIAFTGDSLQFFEINDENETVKFTQDLPTKECAVDPKTERVMYTQAMDYIITMTSDGGIHRLPIKAEKRQDDQKSEDEGDGKKGTKKTVRIDVRSSLIGMFHNSKVLVCEELKGSQYLFAASENGLATIHDLASGEMVSYLNIEASFTYAAINHTGNMVVLGSRSGCIRILDITNPKTIRVVMCKKVHKTQAVRVIKFSPDQTMLCFALEKSNRVYFMSGTPENKFEVYGFSYLPGTVLDLDWSNSVKTPIDSKKNRHLVEVTIKNGLVTAVVPQKGITTNPYFQELSQDLIGQLGRRVDYDITLSVVDPESGDFFSTGEEKILRRYKQPDEYVRDMDTRPRAPLMPLIELDGHDLKTNCILLKASADAFVSGGLDGTVIKRSTKNPKDDVIKMQTQNYYSRGVSACSCSDTYPLLYSGGFDGSLLVHYYDEFNMKNASSGGSAIPSVADCSKMSSLPVEGDSEVKFYETILEEENRRLREDEKYHTQKEMKEKLMAISNELKRLLLKNKDAQDIEKIERDEFCLDLELRDKLLNDGEKEVDKIKKDAEYKNMKEELFHKKLTMLTYSKLDSHLKTLTGLKDNILVANFAIRKKEKQENQKYKFVSNLRAVEMAERAWRKENKLYDPADVKDLIAPPEYYRTVERKDNNLEDFMQEYPDTKQIIIKPENFICNLKQGKQKVLLLDHAKREDERQKTIAAALEYDKTVDLKDAHMEAPDRPPALGYRLHRMSRNPKNKRKAGGAQTKDDAVEDEKEDMLDQEADKDEEGMKDWDQMYGAFELFTTKRKKSQSLFLKNIVFKIKRSFNREFDSFSKLRAKEIERINDLNFLIAEQMAKLNEICNPFTPIVNIIDNPNQVLELGDNEVGIEKYLTKREKKDLEEKRLRDEARQKEMQKNDANFRALKGMMNNTLEEKKESILTNEIVKEPWMEEDKVESMTDEQKVKYEDYKIRKQKFDEEAEKFRKKLEQDLKKLNDKIEEICTNFDNKLFILFTKRLEYQYKLYEQENYIIKVNQSIQSQKNFRNAIEIDKQRLQLIEEAIQENRTYLSALKRTREEKQSEIQANLDVHKLGLVKSNRHDLTLQLENYNDKLNNERGAMKEYMEEKFKEFMSRNPEFERRLNEVDLMFEVENTCLRKMGLFDLDQYKPEIEEAERAKNPQFKGGQTLFSRFKQIIETELKKRKQLSEVNRQEAIISDCQINDEELTRQKEKMEEEEANHNFFLAQEHDNIYIQMRFLKRMVELPLQLSFQVLEKAVLVHVRAISDINDEIKKKGKSKVSQLNDKLKAKNDLDEIKFTVLEKELRIEELILESMGITRLKVTRQLQATISNEKETETEEKNLEEQIKTLKETREKRIKDMEKKEKAMRKEIESIKVQNDTLSSEGAKLLDTVKQRKKIASLMNGAIDEEENEEVENEKAEQEDGRKRHLRLHRSEKPKDVQSYEKAMQIAQNRQLFDKAKKLAQEFEILMQELKKLKARTFPQIPSGKNNFL